MAKDQAVLIDRVRRALETDQGEAREVVEAVLTTLGERLSFEQARQLAGTLPEEFGDPLTRAEPGQGFDRETFIERVADRTGSDPRTAQGYARTVLAAVGAVASPTALENVRDQLPDDLALMLGPLPDRRAPRPIKKGDRPFAHRPSTKEGDSSGRDEMARYGRQGSN